MTHVSLKMLAIIILNAQGSFVQEWTVILWLHFKVVLNI